MPLNVIAGTGDKVIGFRGHSQRLHQEAPGSRLDLIDGAGHMLPHTAHQQVLAATAAPPAGSAPENSAL